MKLKQKNIFRNPDDSRFAPVIFVVIILAHMITLASLFFNLWF